MNKINKIFLKLSLLGVSTTLFSVVSCINSSENSQLKNKIPTGFEFVPNNLNPQEIATNEIIDNLVNLRFRDDEVGKVNFLNSQKNEEELFNQFSELSRKYLEFKTDEGLNLLRSFYTNNWLFVIKNIEKFSWTYSNWWTFPELETAKHTEEFFARLDKQSRPDNLKFFDNYWDQLREGDESFESPNDVYYLRKGRILIRVLISKNNDENKVLTFDKIAYFSRSRTQNISIKLVSDAYHNGIVHRQQQGFDSFEKEVIDNFGFPALGALVYKGGK
ncbi:aromatic motif membrane protein [Mycoplasma sp. CSL7503-lung]|uniref:aromatic motif membrane protein n=1 Tax=Mycoplasma sp. CSL7503-lung TaxID=536372 RepID=UPI0021D2AE5B|nr:aromatic motif membrane protein [Mycoplasma sp. CSL7503-lung]MCU4706625.1 hypothetical protein [Mycoplasma sp. CSL7503-lung]